MASLRISNRFLGLLIVIFGLLAHNGLADVSHVVNREYLPPNKGYELVYKIVHEYAQPRPELNHNRNYLPPHITKPSLNYFPAKDMRDIPNYEIKYPDIGLTLPELKSAHSFNAVENIPKYKGDTYLPPYQSFGENHQNTHQQSSYEQNPSQHNSFLQQVTIKVPTFLPSGYDYKNPNQGQSHSDIEKTAFNAPTYLPPAYGFKNLIQEQNVPEAKHNTYQENVEHTVTFKLPTDLPAGYDFVKPDGAAKAIAELHTLPDDDHHESKMEQEQNLAFTVQQPSNEYLSPTQIGKIRTVQILNSVAVKTLRVLETEHNGVKHIKILGHSNEIPTGEHHVVKVETPGSHAQTVKIFKNSQPNEQQISSDNYYGNFPVNSYLPPQASHASHKRSVRVSSETYQTSL